MLDYFNINAGVPVVVMTQVTDPLTTESLTSDPLTTEQGGGKGGRETLCSVACIVGDMLLCIVGDMLLCIVVITHTTTHHHPQDTARTFATAKDNRQLFKLYNQCLEFDKTQNALVDALGSIQGARDDVVKAKEQLKVCVSSHVSYPIISLLSSQYTLPPPLLLTHST